MENKFNKTASQNGQTLVFFSNIIYIIKHLCWHIEQNVVIAPLFHLFRDQGLKGASLQVRTVVWRRNSRREEGKFRLTKETCVFRWEKSGYMYVCVCWRRTWRRRMCLFWPWGGFCSYFCPETTFSNSLWDLCVRFWWHEQLHWLPFR